jgi:hypothetical protein
MRQKRILAVVLSFIMILAPAGVASAQVDSSAVRILDRMVDQMADAESGAFRLQSKIEVDAEEPDGGDEIQGTADITSRGDWTADGPAGTSRVRIESGDTTENLRVVHKDNRIYIRESGEDTWKSYRQRTLSGAHGRVPIPSFNGITQLELDDLEELRRLSDGEINGREAYRVRADVDVQKIFERLIEEGAFNGDRDRLEELAEETEGRARVILWVDKGNSVLRRVELRTDVSNEEADVDRFALRSTLNLGSYNKDVRIPSTSPSEQGRLRDFPFNLDNLVE